MNRRRSPRLSAGFLFKRVLHMTAIERMVRAYVQLRNRKKLENMKVYRRRLVIELKFNEERSRFKLSDQTA